MSSEKCKVMSTVSAIRSQTAVWLVGHPRPKLLANSLQQNSELVANYNRAQFPVAFQ